MIPEFKKNKSRHINFRKTVFPIFLVLVIFSITVFLIIINIRTAQKASPLSEKLESLKKEIQKSEGINQELKKQISEGSQEEFVEREARERLNLKKPGEEVVVVLPPAENKQEIEIKKNFFQKFLDEVKDWFRP